MKSLALASLAPALLLTACGSAMESQTLAASRVAFRCTPQGTTRSFEIQEKDGLVSINGSTFKSVRVTKDVGFEGDFRTYIFHEVNMIDGVAHNVAVTIGTDANPDSISTDGDNFQCKTKATINSAVLDFLVERSMTPGEKAHAKVMKNADQLRICDGDRWTGYGLSAFQEEYAPGKWLIHVQCSLGAYQGSYQLVSWDDAAGKGRIVPVENFDFEATNPMAGNGEMGHGSYDPATRILTNFAKGRGIGDCGAYTTFKPFDGEGFRIATVQAKDCDGVFTEPDTWPVVFQAE